MARRIKSHVFEKIIAVLMLLFGFTAIYIFASSQFGNSQMSSECMAVIQILLILVLTILAQTLILIKVYEQHI
jgi:hypothetical protein